MNTAIIYSQHEDITEKIFVLKIRTVSALLTNGGGLSLICFDGKENVKKVINRAAKNNDVLLFTESFVNENCVLIANLLKGKTIGYFKKCLTTVLPTVENKFFDTIAHLLCLCSNAKGSYAFNYVDIYEKSLQETLAIIAAECLFSNPHLYVFEFENIVRVLIVAQSEQQSSAETLCNDAAQQLKAIFGDNAFSNDFEELTETVVRLLHEHNLKVATAESCTAGMLSSAITSVSGASAVFEIGISSYADRIKKAALGVSDSTLKKYGAVSMQTAAEMARGIKLLSDADIGISATGVAGPNGSEHKPVGTVYISLTDGRKNWVIDLNLDNSLSRDEIRRKTTFACLDLLRRYLLCLPDVLPDGADVNSPLFLLYEQPHFEPQLEYVSKISEDGDVLPIEEIGFTVNEEFPFDEEVTTTEYKKTFEFNLDTKSVIDRTKNFLITTYKKYKEILKDADKKKKLTVNLVSYAIIASIIIGSFSVYSYFNASNKNRAIIDTLRAKWNFTSNVDLNGHYTDFNNFSKINSDINGWITVGNNQVNLPVCQTLRGDYYKKHNYKKRLSSYGALYFKGNINQTDNTKFKNTVIYGNSPADSSMFAPLKNYRSLEFLKNNANIELVTKYSHCLYQVFAVMIIDSNNTNDFNCTTTDFTYSDDFNEWIDEAYIRSLYKLTKPLPDNFQTITLITDTDEFDGAKLVVIGYSVNKFDESYPSTLEVNPSPYYPDAWYSAHSSVNPYENSKPTASLPSATPDDPSFIIYPDNSNDTLGDTSSDTAFDTTSDTANDTL